MNSRSRTPGPFAAVASCLARPMTWGGRSSVSEFWWFAAPFIVIQFLAMAWLLLPPTRVVLWWHAAYTSAEARAYAAGVAFRPPEFPDISIPIRWMTMDWTLWFLGSILPTLAFISVTIRRLHDTGHSGWWLWLLFVPGVGIALLVVLLIAPSEMHRNRYGAGKGVTVIVGPRDGIELDAVRLVDNTAALRALRESRMQA